MGAHQTSIGDETMKEQPTPITRVDTLTKNGYEVSFTHKGTTHSSFFHDTDKGKALSKAAAESWYQETLLKAKNKAENPTSQRKWQIANVAKGYCQNHSKIKIAPSNKTYCEECYQRVLKASRIRNNRTLKDKLISCNGSYFRAEEVALIAKLIGQAKLSKI